MRLSSPYSMPTTSQQVVDRFISANNEIASQLEKQLKSLFPGQHVYVEQGGRGLAIEVMKLKSGHDDAPFYRTMYQDVYEASGVRVLVSGPKWPEEAEAKPDRQWVKEGRVPSGVAFRRIKAGPTDKVLAKVLEWFEKSKPKLKL